ncbi:MAG: AAA family ATPase [Methanomicrobiaceae archaeon]|nr:AAA family ATPase [Methanomicrobiaceae archaeon]
MSASCTIVVSGKGGTGKTTISALLVAALVEAGETPVLAVDADPNANLHEALGLSVEESLGSMREEAFTRSIPAGMNRTGYIKYRFRKVLLESVGFDLLVMGRPEGSGCYCFPNSLLSECIAQLKEDYRYVIVDSEAGLEHLSRGTIRAPDILLIVSDPGARGIRTAQRIHALAQSVGLAGLPAYLVINRKQIHGPIAIEPGEGLPVLAILPEDEAISHADLSAAPLVSVPASSPARAEIRILARKLLDRCARGKDEQSSS